MEPNSTITLSDTVNLMVSKNYKERVIAEYWQLKIRYDKLKIMLDKWDYGDLDFLPECPRELYNIQICGMKQYMDVLERRAKIENIDLDFVVPSDEW